MVYCRCCAYQQIFIWPACIKFPIRRHITIPYVKLNKNHIHSLAGPPSRFHRCEYVLKNRRDAFSQMKNVSRRPRYFRCCGLHAAHNGNPALSRPMKHYVRSERSVSIVCITFFPRIKIYTVFCLPFVSRISLSKFTGRDFSPGFSGVSKNHRV